MQLQQARSTGKYYSYLLRLWRVQAEEGGNWRASLETVGSGERRGFARLDKLFVYLEQTCRDSVAPTPNSPDSV